MLKKSFKLILFFGLIALIVLSQGKFNGASLFAKNPANQNKAVVEKIAKEAYPNADTIKAEENGAFLILDKEQNEIAKMLYSSPYADDISGFSGSTPLVIFIEKDKVSQIELLKNSETPEYLKQVLDFGFLKKWNTLSLKQAFSQKVDAVSGATFTSSAIRDTVKRRLSVELGEETKKEPVSSSVLIKNCAILAVLLLALVAFFKQYKKLRILTLTLSFFVLGAWQGNMLSLTGLAGWLINGVPFAMQWGLFIVFLFAILLPLFTKKTFYCYYLCPFGGAQEIIGMIGKKKIKIDKKLLAILSYGRAVMLIFALLVLLLSALTKVANLEPFSAFNPQSAPVFALGIAIVSLILSFFVNRPFCRWACPCGAVLDLPKTLKK